MDDKELLELAAKAAGIELEQGYGEPPEKVMFYMTEDHQAVDWDPLSEDGDALRLAVKCGIEIWPDREAKEVVVGLSIGKGQNMFGLNFSADFEDDEMAATRRAIVRAAAQIGYDMIRAKEPAYAPLGQASAF